MIEPAPIQAPPLIDDNGKPIGKFSRNWLRWFVQLPKSISDSAIPAGSITGDIIRWDAVSNAWEVKSEPFEFKGLVLTPALASLIDAEGAIYYNSSNKAVMVCTGV